MKRKHDSDRLVGLVTVVGCLTLCVEKARAQTTIETLRSQNGKRGIAGYFGQSAAKVGDVDGDGVAEALVGAPLEAPVFAGRWDGVVYMFSGATGVVLLKLDGPSHSQFGTDVASGQDFDGDGVADIVVGAPFYGNAAVGAGFVYSGKSGALLYSKFGKSGGNYFGNQVMTMDDVDGDGIGDFGLAGVWPGTSVLNVYSGKTGKQLYTWTPSSSRITSVVGLADVDGDGLAEIGAGSYSGEFDVLRGKDASLVYSIVGLGHGGASRLGDVDGDGMDDFAVADPQALNGQIHVFSAATGVELFRVDGPHNSENLGVLPKDGRLDFNHDGVPDVLVGSPDDANPWTNPGWAYVFSGRDGTMLYQFDGQTGTGTGESLGYAVCPLGDVNGDGIDDVLAGAPDYEDKTYGYGQAYVYAGNDLFLESDKSTYMAGDNIEVDTRGGVPWATELLAAIDVNGTPQFTVVDVEQLDQDGNYALIDNVPSGLQGLDVTFQAFATRAPRKGLAESSTIVVSFQ